MRRHSRSLWSNGIFALTVSAAAGGAVSAVLAVAFAALSFFVFGTMQFVGLFANISLTVGAYISGLICGRYRRNHGMVNGILCGIILSAVITAAALTMGNMPNLWKTVLLITAGAVGGVRGVNTDRPENLM